MTKSTEKIIRLRRANHRVIGGSRQNVISQIQSPGMLAEDEKGETAHAENIAVGPKMYIPARTQPHFGIFLRIVQLIKLNRAKPAKEAKFRASVLSVHLWVAESSTNGIQKASPPSAIEHKACFTVPSLNSERVRSTYGVGSGPGNKAI